jgi:putative ABC transport system ATP-binding protein
MEPLLSLHEVAWRTPGGVEVFSGVSLEVRPGEVVWLSGPSGGGKSTLLRLMNRLLSPAAGEIRFRGRPLDQWPPTGLRRRVALLSQVPVMLAGTVRDNLLLPFRLRAARGAEPPDDQSLRAALAELGLEGVGLEDRAAALSVGQQQRVAFARLLLMGPEVLLLDEPVAALDPDSGRRLEERVARAAAQGLAVVMVSHQPPQGLEAPPRRLVLEGGRLEEQP